MEFTGRIGLLSSDEARECLKDIDTFLKDENNPNDFQWVSTYVVVTGSDGNINNDTVVSIPLGYGIFNEQMDAPLYSLFGSHPPYKNTLDAFRAVAPKWFVDKYEQKNREWEEESEKQEEMFRRTRRNEGSYVPGWG